MCTAEFDLRSILFFIFEVMRILIKSKSLQKPILSGLDENRSQASTERAAINCCIYQPAFGCCALLTLVEIVIFSVFYAKKLKKARNLQQIFAKKHVF